MCSRVYKGILTRRLPRRMPCKKFIQVVGTQESRTLLSNQLTYEDRKMNQKQPSFIEEPNEKTCFLYAGNAFF
jgi:hypothetical protein